MEVVNGIPDKPTRFVPQQILDGLCEVATVEMEADEMMKTMDILDDLEGQNHTIQL